jgi:hypothetical protein
MIHFLRFRFSKDRRQRFGDGLLQLIPVNLGKGTGDHEGGDVRVKVVDMGQTRVG